jgi:carboxypeptidase T
MWRKNRKLNQGGSYGVDLNRNWKSGFGGSGSSGSPSSETYRGTAAYSEPETKTIADYLGSQSNTLKAAIDFHSYSQLNLRPWGKTSTVN